VGSVGEQFRYNTQSQVNCWKKAVSKASLASFRFHSNKLTERKHCAWPQSDLLLSDFIRLLQIHQLFIVSETKTFFLIIAPTFFFLKWIIFFMLQSFFLSQFTVAMMQKLHTSTLKMIVHFFCIHVTSLVYSFSNNHKAIYLVVKPHPVRYSLSWFLTHRGESLIFRATWF